MVNKANRQNLIKDCKEEFNLYYDEILQKVRKICSDKLGIGMDEIAASSSFSNDLLCDSLTSLEIVMALESELDLMLDNIEYTNKYSVEDIAKQIYYKKYGRELHSEHHKGKDIIPVSLFENSREYMELTAKKKALGDVELPYFIPHDSVVRDTSIINGKEVLNFGSYNYLGLSGHPITVKAAKDAAEKYGTSSSGSRILAGEKSLYIELEREIANWKHADDAIVLVSGNATNTTVIGNLCNDNDLIMYDSLSHNSIIQGCKLSDATARSFPHNDFKTLDLLLEKNRKYYEKVLIVIEGVYSMDGDIAPVKDFVYIKKKHQCFLMVDEAHSSCVIGERGNGVDEYFGLMPNDIDIKMGTLSKGVGTCGGYIAGSYSLIDYLKYCIPGFVFAAGISPILAASSLEAIKHIRKDNTLVKQLHESIKYFLKVAHHKGFDTGLAKESAIVPIIIGDEGLACELSNQMLQKGVFVPPAIYPAVPMGEARLRFCLTSMHRPEQIDQAIDILFNLIKENTYQLTRLKNVV
ncbi:aminotransferase class I/II-fold pyridoxal phosphate-dependent enzyme [Vallitalea okinawensis]|uniref:aminotransferase class I/II-fold pyridoxal phosphate-dependent enzyme n=1 Tax=Vallitalea okinawensis TaxID=2078660 RepID=UPI00130080F1|nr:aminotransferase class I/II-fold pyridoxal phosphate-dependent enzyme [Vallitalea okinawensis]